MKLRDLTINQIVEICKSRSACDGCSLSYVATSGRARYLKCVMSDFDIFSPPRKNAEHVLDREVADVDADRIVRCADCTHAEIYGNRVVCERAPGASFTIRSFCSEGVKR